MTGSKTVKHYIYLQNVSKKFSQVRGLGFVEKKPRTVISNMTLAIAKGERVGLIGCNGSGKTTILKIIAGISSITSGKLTVEGRVNSLMELGAGFNPDLTGRENILLNGMLAGATRSEIKNTEKEIIEYSGIEKYIDLPFYTYSAGMKLRLAFSVAIHANPDILLFDEIVAMGDEKFINSFKDYFSKIVKEKKTVIFATHVLDVLPLYCPRVIWMDKGKVVMDGKSEVVIAKYRQEMSTQIEAE